MWDFGLLALLGLAGGTGQYLMTQAFRLAPAAVIAPFNYTAMIWASLFGFLIWSELPTPALLVGGSIVAGLFVGAVVLLPPMLCRAYFDSAMYGRIYSVIAVGVYAGGGLGPSIAGVIRDASTDARPALLCLAAMSVAAAVVVLSLPERKR